MFLRLFFLSTLFLALWAFPKRAFPVQNNRVQDTSQILARDYLYYDALIKNYDSLGNYLAALNASEKGLKLSKDKDDKDRESGYHLKLAKYHYLTRSPENALSHFRLYALSKSSDTENKKDLEMLQLEKAYLEEIDEILLEMNMDKTLIQNLQEENERYYQVQQKIKLAIQVGIGAMLVISIIVIYNQFKSQKDKNRTQVQEVNDLQRFRDQVEKLDEELERTNNELSKLKEVQQHNLAYARNIQLSLLPPSLELSESIGHSFVLHIPRDIVSGDFYALHKNGDKTVLAVFDCAGYGVNAAHSTVVSHNLFDEIVSQGITAPSMILTMMDQKLKHETKQLEPRKELLSGVKMAICTIKNETKEVEYAGAHFPLFYVHLDELHFVRGNRFPIGDPLFSNKFYSSSNLRLSSGDMIYLSSDGYYGQLGGKKNKKFLRASFNNLLNTIYNQEIEEQQFIIEKVFQEWKAHEEQTDDVLVMGFRL
jgi:serine phosphatase RsbU (regulator of sigma subunit)